MEQQLPLFPELEPTPLEPVDVDEIARKIAANASTPEHRRLVHEAYDRVNKLGAFVEPETSEEEYIPVEQREWPENKLTETDRQIGKRALAFRKGQ